MKLKIGQQVRFVPLKDVRVFGFEDDHSEKIGVVSYINIPHKWFLVEYDGIGCKLRSGYKFCDIGLYVFIEDKQHTNNDAHYCISSVSKSYIKGYEKRMSIANYVAAKVNIMRDLGVTPTRKEWDKLMSLDSEIKVDNAVRTILKKRWAQRNYK